MKQPRGVGQRARVAAPKNTRSAARGPVRSAAAVRYAVGVGSLTSRYSLGLDFGTSSVRALIVELASGEEVGAADWMFEHGEQGVIVDADDPNVARQWPGDYAEGLRRVVPQALAAAQVSSDDIVGIGVDATGSTPLPVDARCAALTECAELAGHPAAMAWLWKDHTAHAEAEEITELARRLRPEYLERCGGTYSSEWFWSKALRCLRTAPEVFERAHSFVELCDYVPALLTGARDPARLVRGVCAAGHKAMYAPHWGGLPDREFLGELAPELAELRSRLFDRAYTAAERAGEVDESVARELGLRAGTAVAVGAIDAHLGAVGAGIAEGDLVKVMGTSTCDMAIAQLDEMPRIDGLCGMVEGSIVPGQIGFEAGQSAVGDIFHWAAHHLAGRDHADLARDAAQLRPGESGLLALDWHNGNRCVLVDPALSGLLVGLNLQSKDHEIYRAMIEATAFGARVIIERLMSAGVPVRSVVACGGIANKSALVMQIYADVLARPVAVSSSSQTCALGAAITGAVVGEAYPTVAEAQRAMCPPRETIYQPRQDAVEVYRQLFSLYQQLHDAFGVQGHRTELGGVMKELLALRATVRG